MKAAELLLFEALNSHVTIYDDIEAGRVCFRNERLSWYQNNQNGCTAIDYGTLDGLDADGLMRAVNKGLEVEQITRITGYMTKVSSWNKGKIGELKDRRRMTVGPCQATCPAAGV